MICPCGSNNKYSECCEPIHLKKVEAQTPEQLMRSRYSAYALNKADYIYQTYAKSSQKEQSIEEIKAWAEETNWLNLNVKSSSEYKNTTHPTVTFEAIYKNNNIFYKMKETSRFIKEIKVWRYIDGNHLYFEELNIPKRNDECICLSGKKYKKCCAV